MKKHLLLTFALFWIFTVAFSQETRLQREKAAVLSVDTKGISFSPAQMGDLLRLELNRLDMFEVMDQYDISYIAEKEKLDVSNCYGKICLLELGQKLGADKMVSGTINQVPNKIIVSLKVLDVKSEAIEKTEVVNYLNLPNQIQLMLEFTLRKMYGLPLDEQILKQLSQTESFETPINTPTVSRLNLSGPRMGCSIFSGTIADRIKAPGEEGGLNGYPVMFQFGYQFETSYLNQGGLQALFEFIPIITGFDQGQFIPSINIMHGLRANKGGWEFAFGPNFSVTQTDRGFFDAQGKWVRIVDWEKTNPGNENKPYAIELLDNRGTYGIHSAFIFAFGKSFRSGKLNIPINAFFIPSKYGHRFGISFGFNARG